jgi:hypothetical protein
VTGKEQNMSQKDNEAKKPAYTLTNENILTTATKEEYEGGEFKLISYGGQEIGIIKVAEYRKLKKQPFKEPLTYLVQLFNYLWVFFNMMSKITMLVPICYFWFLVAGAIYGGVDLKSLTAADFYSPVLFQFSFLTVSMPVILSGLIFRKNVAGYIDIFKKRFHQLLIQEIPALNDYEKFKLEWVKIQ